MMARRSTSAAILLAVTLAACILPVGCKRDVRLADHKLRNPIVGTVTHYGQTLDQSATPEQVTHVLLRAMRDDFLADTTEAREKALDVQFDVCAAGQLALRNVRSISDAEYIYNVVYHWTPTVAHYVHDIDEDFSVAQERFVKKNAKSSAGGVHVMTTLQDPSGDANAQVVVVVTLVRDDGYWRVRHVGFEPTRRSLTDVASSQKQNEAETSQSGG